MEINAFFAETRPDTVSVTITDRDTETRRTISLADFSDILCKVGIRKPKRIGLLPQGFVDGAVADDALEAVIAVPAGIRPFHYMGEYTPTVSGRKRVTKVFTEKYPNIAYVDALYKPFELPEEDAMSLNIVQHEIRILKPEKIVFCFGKDYDGQFERDFGKEVYNKVRDLIASLSITEKPVSESREITLFGTGDKAVKVNVIFTLHPSAHMSGDSKGGIRKKYNDEIANFINSSNLG